MKVFHTFFCLLFIALQDGNTGLVNAENEIYTEMEGEDITVECLFSYSGRRKFFCKETCEGKRNILIKTTKDNDQRGRYSIEYKEVIPAIDTIVSVTIKQLKTSDSGRYRCALETSLFPASFWDFEIVVTDALTMSEPKLTLRPFPPSTFLPSASTATTPTEQSLSSTSGRCKPPSASTEPSEQLDPSPARSDLQLYVALMLVVKIFILSMPLMILCKKRRSTKPEVLPVETNYVNVTEVNRVYEEIREKDRQSGSPHVQMKYADVTESNRMYEEIREEDRQSGSPHVEISSLYCNAKHTKPNRAGDASA